MKKDIMMSIIKIKFKENLYLEKTARVWLFCEESERADVIIHYQDT